MVEVKVSIPKDLPLESMSNMLRESHEWKSISRDLKIYSLLDKKCELNIKSIYVRGELENQPQIWDTAFIVRSLSFIVGKEALIESMTCKIITLNTKMGNTLSQLMEHLPQSIEINLAMDGNKAKGFNAQVSKTQTQ